MEENWRERKEQSGSDSPANSNRRDSPGVRRVRVQRKEAQVVGTLVKASDEDRTEFFLTEGSEVMENLRRIPLTSKPAGQVGTGGSSFGGGLWGGAVIRSLPIAGKTRSVSSASPELFRPGCAVFSLVIDGDQCYFPRLLVSIEAQRAEMITIPLGAEKPDGYLWVKSLGYKNHDTMYRDSHVGCIPTIVGVKGLMRKEIETTYMQSPNSLIIFAFSSQEWNENRDELPAGMHVKDGIRDLTKFFNIKTIPASACASAMELALCLTGLKMAVSDFKSYQAFTNPLELVLVKAAYCPETKMAGVAKPRAGAARLVDCNPEKSIRELASSLDSSMVLYDFPRTARPEFIKAAAPPGDRAGVPIYLSTKGEKENWINPKMEVITEVDSLGVMSQRKASLWEYKNLSPEEDWLLSKSVRLSTHAMRKEYESKGRCFYGAFTPIEKTKWGPVKKISIPLTGSIYTEYGTALIVKNVVGGELEVFSQEYYGRQLGNYPIIIMSDGIAEEAAPNLSEALGLMAECLREGARVVRTHCFELTEIKMSRWELPVIRAKRPAKNKDQELSKYFGRFTGDPVGRELIGIPLLIPPENTTLPLKMKISKANCCLISSLSNLPYELSGFAVEIPVPESIPNRSSCVEMLGVPISYVQGCRVVRLVRELGRTVLELSERIYLSSKESQQKFLARALMHCPELPPDDDIQAWFGLESTPSYRNSTRIQKLRDPNAKPIRLTIKRRPLPPSEGSTALLMEVTSAIQGLGDNFIGLDSARTKKIEQGYMLSEDGSLRVALPVSEPFLELPLLDDSKGEYFSRLDIESKEFVLKSCRIFEIDTSGITSYLGTKLVTIAAVSSPSEVMETIEGRVRTGSEISRYASQKIEDYGNQRAEELGVTLFRAPPMRNGGDKLTFTNDYEVGRLRLTKTRLNFVAINSAILFDNLVLPDDTARAMPLYSNNKIPLIYPHRAEESASNPEDPEDRYGTYREKQGEEVSRWTEINYGRRLAIDNDCINERDNIKRLLRAFRIGILTPEEAVTLINCGWFPEDLDRVIIKAMFNDAWEDDDPVTKSEVASLLKGAPFQEKLEGLIEFTSVDDEICDSLSLYHLNKEVVESYCQQYASICPRNEDGKYTFFKYKVTQDTATKPGSRIGGLKEIAIFLSPQGRWESNPRDQVIKDRASTKMPAIEERVVAMGDQTFCCSLLYKDRVLFTSTGRGKIIPQYDAYRQLILSGEVKRIKIPNEDDCKSPTLKIFNARDFKLRYTGNLVIGYDSEWKQKGPITCMQISFGNGNVFLYVPKDGDMPAWVKTILEDPKVTKVGFDLVQDKAKLSMLSINYENFIDLSDAQPKLGISSISLNDMSKVLLKKKKTFSLAESFDDEDIGYNELSLNQRIYAAEDAKLCLDIAHFLKDRMLMNGLQNPDDGVYEIEAVAATSNVVRVHLKDESL